MIDWLIAQQGVLCISLAMLVLTERHLTARLGTLLTYKLWLLVPLLLIANNLPVDMVAIESAAFSRYVVGVRPDIVNQDINILFSVWAVGASTIAAYVLVHHVTTWRSISKRKAINTEAYYSSKAATPMLFGLFAPKVLLPYWFKSAFTPAQQALILEHENVHRQHCDHLWNTLALVLAAVFWFNPLSWIALKSFRINQELACDHSVLQSKTEKEKINYAKALVQCAQECSTTITLYPTFGEKVL